MAVSTQIIVFKKSIVPVGNKNGVNLDFEAPEKFDPDTLEIFLSGLYLDKDLDFEIIDDTKFKIILAPELPERLNCPPLQGEPFRINYVLC